MLLKNDQIRHIQSVAHAGKVVIVATCVDGAILYTVRQDGFEPSYLNAPAEARTAWEAWRELPLPDDAVGDASVAAREAARLTVPSSDPNAPPGATEPLLRSRYQTKKVSAVAPVQLVSGREYLFVFRQSVEGTLLADRFVLDGITNELKPKIEVRFRRSRQKYSSSAVKKGAGGLQGVDTLDFTDLAGNYFYEPTTELSLIKGLVDGAFAVVQVPTSEHERYRWHVFTVVRGELEIVSLRTSEDGLFDPRDYTAYDSDPSRRNRLVPRVIPGVLRRALDLAGVTITGGPTAAVHDIQREAYNSATHETHLLRVETRVMLLVPTDRGTTALSFAIAGDGTLSRVSEALAGQRVLRADRRPVILPLNTLDQIRVYGAAAPVPEGTILGMTLGTEAEGARGLVIVTSPEAAALQTGDVVEIAGTLMYDGLYPVSGVLGSTFRIAAPFSGDALGTWKKQEQVSLVFDGMVTSYQWTDDHKMRVSAAGHGLVDGDEVHIAGTTSYDGAYPVTKLDDTHFVIEQAWAQPVAEGAKLLSRRRRGVVLDGQRDWIEMPPACLPGGDEITVSLWARGGDGLPRQTVALWADYAGGLRTLCVHLPWDNGAVYFDCGGDKDNHDRVERAAAPTEYRGGWTHWAFTKNAATGEMKIFRNGALWASAAGKHRPVLPAGASARTLCVGRMGSGGDGAFYYEGTVADLRIWARALDEREIRDGMYKSPSGKEADLMGCWPLGAIVEGAPRTVLDFSSHGRDGTIHCDGAASGGAYVSAVALPRTLADGVTPAVQYGNDELFAVVENATYTEELEFRVVAPVAVDPRDVDGHGGKLFRFSHWGKRSRSADDRIPVDGLQTLFEDLKNGWYRAACQVTIPAGVALLRTFELADVAGDWTSLEVRHHRITLVSDVITETRHVDPVAPADAPAPGSAQERLLALGPTLRELLGLEQQEGALVLEQRALSDKLARMKDLAAINLDLGTLTKKAAELDAQVKTLLAAYEAAAADPLNYVCRASVVIGDTLYKIGLGRYEDGGGGGQRACIYGSGGARVRFTQRRGTECRLFEVESLVDGWRGLTVYNQSEEDEAFLTWSPGGNLFRFDSLTKHYFRAFVQLKTEHGVHVHYQYTNDTNYLVSHRGAGNVFEFTPTDEVNGTTIDDARAAWSGARSEFDAITDYIKTLQELKSADPAVYKQRLAAIDVALAEVRTKLKALQSPALLQDLATVNDPGGAASWPMPTLVTDARGLVTQRASLDLVRAASRLSAIETCEGRVQVSYVDEDGRLRQALYNACADSKGGATFERWSLDPPRGCLDVSRAGSLLALERPLLLGSDWTIEAWFYYPLPPTSWNTLASAAGEKQCQLVVRDGKFLGSRLGGLFFSSGYSLERLRPGWHHVTAVRRSGDDASIRYYLDGEPVGEPVRPSAAVLTLDGSKDVVTLAKESVPAGDAMTFAVWVKADPAHQSGHLVTIGDPKKDLLTIQLLHTGPISGRVVFTVGADTLTYDFTRTPDEWTHWVFVKNVGLGMMSVHRNGKRVAVAMNMKSPLPVGATRFTLGQTFRGALLDPALWGRSLWDGEVAAQVGRSVTGKESGLAGSWWFVEKRARDRLQKPNDGTLDGAPVVTTLSFDGAQIDVIGNAPERLQAGVPVQPGAVVLPGGQRYVQLAPSSFPAGNEVTICFWALGAATLPGGGTVVLHVAGTKNERVLNIHLPWADQVVYFDCGIDIKGNDRVSWPAAPAIYRGAWTHWAFTKNAATGEMKIYCNGTLCASGTGKTKPLTAAQRFTLGAWNDGTVQFAYAGAVTELSVWRRALAPDEIQKLKGSTLTGAEPDLCAYLRFDPTKAVDLTATKGDGTYVGGLTTAPSAVTLTPPPTLVPGGQPFGKLAEARVWSVALTRDEVAVNSKTDLGGGEPGLRAYFPARAPGTAGTNLVEGAPNAAPLDAPFSACSPPIGNPTNRALVLDGVDDYLALPAMQVDYSGGFTFEAWILLEDIQNPSRIAAFTNDGQWPDLLMLQVMPVPWNSLVLDVGSGQGLMAGAAFDVRRWTHVAATVDPATSTATLYKNGELLKSGPAPVPTSALRNKNSLGGGPDKVCGLFGQMSEVRLWNQARSQREIQASMRRRLSGDEVGLVGYWPLDELAPGSDTRVADGSKSGFDAAVAGGARLIDTTSLPLGSAEAVSAEYSTMGVDPDDGARKMALMRRFHGGVVKGGALLLADKRVEAAELVWVGNGQFAPTLLGYIEGAPPVPSENLTELADYNGATAVELTVSRDLDYSWSRSQTAATGGSLDLFLGADIQTSAGLGVEVTTLQSKIGAKATLNAMNQREATTTVSARSSESMVDRLELRGTQEETARFPDLGRRFVPKNVGYALVVSSLADVFITRLRKSGKMIGYTMLPVDGIPPDINTITFLMNPAYVMQGSLDGLTGTRATSDRFFRNVPDMRAQYGSLYPASYYRLVEAYALKEKLDGDDKRREAYFAQFSAADPNSFAGQIAKADQSSASGWMDRIKEIGDASAQIHAATAFASWQSRMEDLLVAAGKRNIVNSYVWDADGGLHTAQQSFAATVEHTIGGAFNFDASVGLQADISVVGVAVDVTALANVSMTQTMSKTQSTSTGVQLAVDLHGVEYSGITDHKDRPIQPGEKVNRYRFMTFYLEGSTDNFNEFFREVVDPEWLQTNGEEARALRQAMGKANKAWRILHRVTYVERPALAALGGDARPLESRREDPVDALSGYLEALTAQQQALDSKVNSLALYLKAKLGA